MGKQILIEARLSDTFSECWRNDYANQMYDHVLGSFRRNGDGNWTHFESQDKRHEKFLFPQKDGGEILLDYDKDTKYFYLTAKLNEQGSEIFLNSWVDRHFGNLDPQIEETNYRWKNKITTYKVVDEDSKEAEKFAEKFALKDGTKRTESYAKDIENAEFLLYPNVAVESVLDNKGHDCIKNTMFGLYHGEEFMLVGGTEYRDKYDYDSEAYFPEEYNKRPVLYKKVGKEYVPDNELLEKFNQEVEKIYCYNGHSENAFGHKRPHDVMLYANAYMRYGEDENSMWRKGLQETPVKSVDELHKQFESFCVGKEKKINDKEKVKFFIRPEAVYHAVQNGQKGFLLQSKDQFGRFAVFVPENGGNVTAKLIEGSKSFSNWVVVNTTIRAGFRKQYEKMFLNIGGEDLQNVAKEINKRIELKQKKLKNFMKNRAKLDVNELQ